jgi:hypothetical protein
MRIEHFFRRLETYTGIIPTASVAMTKRIVSIMAEVLSILAIATKEAKFGQSSESMSLIFTILTDSISRHVFQEVYWKSRH